FPLRPVTRSDRKAIMQRVFLLFLILTLPAAAQTAPTKAAAAKTPPAPVAAIPPGTNVSLATVEAFLRRMFGQDPNVQYRVLDISPSEVPNVTKVVVMVGDDQRPSTLYVTPD